MDKNTIIGFILIFGILLAWNLTMKPDAERMMEEQRIADSLRMAKEQWVQDSLLSLQAANAGTTQTTPDAPAVQDSQQLIQQQTLMALQYGAFAPAAEGEEKTEVLENDLMRITFSNKGGHISEVMLKKHFKIERDSNHKEFQVPLTLMGDKKNKFEYLLPVSNSSKGKVSTQELYFQAEKQGDHTIIFRADAGQGRFFEQRYTIKPDSYGVDYSLNFEGLGNVVDASEGSIRLNWVQYLDKLELNHDYERMYSTVYFKPTDEDYDYCSCTQDDTEELQGERLKWFAHSQQFFASVLIAKDNPFKGGTFITETLDPENSDLKKVHSKVDIPYGEQQKFAMEMYLGPKDFETLQGYDLSLEYIVPFGRSIIGTANRWIIRPLFNFLSSYIGTAGIVILVLTLIVKVLLYPLTYKMLYSQAKMAALKPRMTSLREKHKEDQTQAQMETMKLYREFGVNPLGGCLPVVLQMPVWFALYRFFPASIEFRQKSFLWATDLSSYDVAFWLPFEIPFYGQHVSLFTLLWVVTTIMYTYYNMQQMEMANMGGANAKMMKYMQFLMPVFFLFFFNNFASGLTTYLVFSNMFNIAQTLITKNLIIDHDKIQTELEAYRKKPKKKGKFASRLEDAMKQQKALAAQREAAAKTTGKKKK